MIKDCQCELFILTLHGLTMQAHVAKNVSNCFAVLRHIHSIRRTVTMPVLQSHVISMVLTRLDYRRATLAGLANTLLNRLQSVLHAAARLIYSVTSRLVVSITVTVG